MPEQTPWDEISVPGVDFNVRQIPGEMPVPCFWGRDATGACLFVVELHGDHSVQYRKNVVAVNGIDVDLRSGDSGRQRLVLTLDKQVDRDLFESLCRTLVSALRSAGDSSSALAISLTHVRRWKLFLSGRFGHNLSADGVRGLFAELCFLAELIDRLPLEISAINSWLGPERSHQDFIYGDAAVEIKALSGSERNSVHISSEDQLEAINRDLFLRIYRLNGLSEAPGARSLNDVVDEIRDHLKSAESVETFDRKLAAYGYAPLPEYDEPRFIVSGVNSYRVGSDFPCLIRSQLPDGLIRVSYEIKLESIAKFQSENSVVFGGV